MGKKYGRIVYGSNLEAASGYCNLGDWFQTFAVDHLYRRMGIPAGEIVNISRYELRTYDGEEVILPMQGWFGHQVKGGEIFPLSPKITPVFIGFHCLSKNVIDIPSLKKWEPIGCRDEATWKFLTKCGVQAYISGCLTVTFPSREASEAGDKVLLIDADQEILSYLPEEMKKRSVKLTQECTADPREPAPILFYEGKAKEQLRRIREAAFVVTSRLHCTGPAIAMGVPVVLAKPYFDERYTWIDKFIPLYTRKDYAGIDWNQASGDVSSAKELILKNAVATLRNTDDAPGLHDEVHQLYMTRSRGEIRMPFYRKLFIAFHERFPKLADIVRNILVKAHPYW